jgi:putative hydrolase of HD superfamily
VWEEERVSLPDPISVAKRWRELGFRILHLVDLDAALEKGDNLDTLTRIAREAPGEFQVGGGVRSAERAETLIAAGANRVIVGTRAVDDRKWLGELADRFQGQVMVAADIRDGTVLRRGWTEASELRVENFPAIRFILECEKLKAVERRSCPVGLDRRENSAEHSWSLALMAMTLIPAVDPSLDTLRVIKMLILHDVVEIDAGDTFCYGDQGAKVELEQAAATRIFGMLDGSPKIEFMELWREFEACETAEAKFANAMDRLMPLLQNHANGGGAWIEHGITLDQVVLRNRVIREVSPELWTIVGSLLDEAVRRGWLGS